jgi:hypothetical protein
MAQEPFRHDLPTHAQAAAMREKAEAEKAARVTRVARWRTAGIWVFGFIGSAMAGGAIFDLLSSYHRDNSMGIIAGACIFGCTRLWLAERGLRNP